ncbi:MAG: hypothetical protein IJ002_08090 [Clostridia bacterium]|nr:hypothetical protein [Clostridia bacterium]
MIVCEITQESKEENTVYGFRFYDKQSGEPVCIVDDVFTDKKSAHALCETINQSDISPEHIQDIIEDAVGSL